jgi:hypothetical protein
MLEPPYCIASTYDLGPPYALAQGDLWPGPGYFAGHGRVRASTTEDPTMCRNIKTLFNFEPPATEDEIRAASLQFVRKISGFNKPSKANEAAFYAAVDDIAGASGRLLVSLASTSPPRNREHQAARARARAARRAAGT